MSEIRENNIKKDYNKENPVFFYRYHFLISALILLCALLSIGVFSNQSIRLDEAQSLWQTSHSLQRTLEIVAQDVHTPLYHVILHHWQSIFDNDVSTARFLSLIFFLLSIPALYLLGKKCYGRSAGFFASLIFALSPFMNWYGSEVRMYSLLALLAILNQYFFVSILKAKRNSSMNFIWAGYALTSILGVYTHYFFFFMLLAQALFFLFFIKEFPRGSFVRFLSIGALVATVFLPWVIYIQSMESISFFRPSIPEPGIIHIFNTFSNFMFGFQTDYVNSILLSLWPLVILMGFLALRKNGRIRPETLFFVFNIIAPIAFAFAVSYAFRPIFLSRYLTFALPSLLLVISWLFSLYAPKISVFFKYALTGAMIVTLFIQTVSAQTPVKENYREATEFLSQATGRDVVVLSAPFTIYPVEYYYKGSASITTLPVWNRHQFGPIPEFSEEDMLAEAERLESNYEKLWLLLSYDQGYAEEIKEYFENNFERLEVKNFSPGLDLYVYRLQYRDEDFETSVARALERNGSAEETSFQ